jgi:hypothetical protein
MTLEDPLEDPRLGESVAQIPVWVITFNAYYGASFVVAVRSTREKAQEYVDCQSTRKHYEIEEWKVDDTLTAERDSAIAERNAMLTALEKAAAERDALRAALRFVQENADVGITWASFVQSAWWTANARPLLDNS